MRPYLMREEGGASFIPAAAVEVVGRRLHRGAWPSRRPVWGGGGGRRSALAERCGAVNKWLPSSSSSSPP